MKRPALRTASSVETWYDMNGISPIRNADLVPRRAAFAPAECAALAEDFRRTGSEQSKAMARKIMLRLKKLAVYPTGFMTFRSDNGQTSGFFHPCAQLDVGTPTSHVGGNGNLAGLTRAGHDLRLFLVTHGS
jgi:hypothetical protein